MDQDSRYQIFVTWHPVIKICDLYYISMLKYGIPGEESAMNGFCLLSLILLCVSSNFIVATSSKWPLNVVALILTSLLEFLLDRIFGGMFYLFNVQYIEIDLTPH